MIMTAILSVVLPSGNFEQKFENDLQDETEKQKNKANYGSYVIREINEKKYCFELYDKQNKLLVRSYNCYKSIEDVKEAISITRRNGEIAEVEDRTVNWIKEANHPKYEMYKEKGLYYFKLSIDNKTLLFRSEAYETVQNCKKQLSKSMASVKSLEIYISVEKLSANDAKQYKNMKPISFGDEEPEEIEQIEEIKKEQTKQKRKKVEKHKKIEQPIQPVQNEPVVEELKVDDSAVVINTAEKKTLWQSYSELSKEQKGFFDGLRKAAQEKEGSREFESSSQLSYVIFRDKLMRIQIRRNTVEAIFMLMDSSFKQLQNDKDIKIKETKTVVKIENEAYYALAIETLNKKYDLLLEQKAERDNKRKTERLEKSRQKRLEKKGKN